MQSKQEQTGGACEEYLNLSRRHFLAASALTSTALMPGLSFARPRSGSGQPDTLVIMFLRGGMDGLTTCVPYGDAELYNARPNLAIAPPGALNGALDLDGFFGFAPSCAPLLRPYMDGKLAVVHACGSSDSTRSHFDAMRFMETATPGMPSLSITSGWFARYLATSPPVGSGDLRSFALSTLMPTTMNEGPGALNAPDPDALEFPGQAQTAAARRAVIESIYEHARAPLDVAATSSLSAIDLLSTIDFVGYVPQYGAVYPVSETGLKLMRTAAMIKADVGLEAMQVDVGGWDHHNQQGPVDGTMAAMLNDLSLALEAFYLDLSDWMDRVTLVAMTEFGRRIAENGTQGTDHGHGGCMLAMGGHIAGGQVLANWPGLATSAGGDVPITIDYRDILSEILARRMGATDLATIFPNYTPNSQGITT